MKKEQFDVTGMTCSACSSHVEKSVSKVEGVDKVSVNLLTNSMQLTYDENKTDAGAIIKAVEDAGYGAAVRGTGSRRGNSDSAGANGTACGAAACSMNGSAGRGAERASQPTAVSFNRKLSRT